MLIHPTFHCIYCWAKEYEILNSPEINNWIDYVQTLCCSRRYSLDQLEVEDGFGFDNIN